MNQMEKDGAFSHVVLCRKLSKEIEVLQPSYSSCSSLSTKTFNFDAVYDDRASQEDVFRESVQPVVDEVLAGFNCTVFAYGMTGSGKTYTMEGSLVDDIKCSEVSCCVLCTVFVIFCIIA